LGQIFDPKTFLYQPSADAALEKLCALADGIQRNDGKIREPAEAEGQRNGTHPHETAVKQECDECLTTGSQGEVGGKGIGCNGSQCRDDADQSACQVADLIAGIIQHGERTGNCQKRATEE
jgi:hypothetical protein